MKKKAPKKNPQPKQETNTDKLRKIVEGKDQRYHLK
jgi:hypothetical protein